LSGRRINDDMGKYVVENTIKQLIESDILIKQAKIGIFGFTFKENCPDTRNTRVIDIVHELKKYGVEPLIFDPVADREEATAEYGFALKDIKHMNNLDVIIAAVNHDVFKRYSVSKWSSFYKNGEKKVMIDVKGIMERELADNLEFSYWRL